MDDYISRKTAIANSREYNLGGSYDNTERAVPVDIINAIPAADVRPVVRGRWEYNPGDNIPYCSECMMPQDSECNFCPNCGARMEES